MKILVLAPQPFYQDRGTPIAVSLLLKSLGSAGYDIDLLTFHEGEERKYQNVKIHRINPIPRVKDIRPGFSVAKLLCDYFMLIKAIKLVKENNYDVLHVIEEAGFIGLLIKKIYGIPYIYDMDSLISAQLVDKFSFLKIFEKFLSWLEAKPIKHAMAVVAVCDELAEKASTYHASNIHVVKDISLMSLQEKDASLNESLDVPEIGNDKVVMYIGNLEIYQGIDLLIQSFKNTLVEYSDVQLIIIGGSKKDIDKYQAITRELNIEDKIHFLGQKPASTLFAYMGQTDILVSPRTQGANTPMKIYSYLHSKKPVLATNLATHTQVMSSQIGMLAGAEPAAFSAAMLKLLKDETLAENLAANAYSFIEAEHSYSIFEENIHVLYRDIEQRFHEVKQ